MGIKMNKNLIDNLLGDVKGTPFSRKTIAKLFDSIERKFFPEIESGKISLAQFIDFFNNEIFEFAEVLEENEREIFLRIVESEAAFRNELKENDPLVKIMDPDADQWSFYIRFKISRPLGVDQEFIKFLDDFSIESDSDLPLKYTTVLKLKNLKKSIYREIIEISKKAEQALIIAFSGHGIGIAYPDDLASEAVQEKIKKAAESSFVSHHTQYHEAYYDRPLMHFGDKYGVVLFHEDSVSWDSKTTQDISPTDTKKLSELFDKSYKTLESIWLVDERFKKIDTATAILTTSLFDDSLINRIILSMTSIEVLSEKILKPESEIEAIDCLMNHLKKTDLDESTKNSIQKSLELIRFQSIGKSCKILIKNLLGKKDAEKFYELYEYRSQLVHAGELKEGKGKMYEVYIESYELARKTLDAYIDDTAKNTLHD